MFRRYCVYLVAFGLLLPLEAEAVKEAVKDVRFRTHGDKVHIYYTLEAEENTRFPYDCPMTGGALFLRCFGSKMYSNSAFPSLSPALLGRE